MEADLVLVISPEAPLMKQLGKVLGKLCTPYDFSTIERGEKYVTIRHDETGLVVAYTSAVSYTHLTLPTNSRV